MKAWVFPCVAALLAGLAWAWYHVSPAPVGDPDNPMLHASDRWTEWRCVPDDGDRVRRVFRDAAGLEVTHVLVSAESLPAGMEQRAWRGGWLQGAPEALDVWMEDPGTMAAHWREEPGFDVSLMRTQGGWVWRGSGTVVWRESGSSVGAGEVWLTSGLPEPWWAGPRGWAPWAEAKRTPEDHLVAAGIPMEPWATRWEGGGRYTLEDPLVWQNDVDRLTIEQGWDVEWKEDGIVVNGDPSWAWSRSDAGGQAQFEGATWAFSSSPRAGLWSVQASGGMSVDVQAPAVSMLPAVAEVVPGTLGAVCNHRTKQDMDVVYDAGKVTALDVDRQEVWSIEADDPIDGVEDIDIYANGKCQALFCTEEALHLVDVKGREVPGFPLKPRRGTWTAWALVDYDSNRKYRYLLASSATGLVENKRREGETTPGWNHNPADGVDVQSPVQHIQHLRLGSRDYVYVGREDGQVELLKRNGSPRAQTPVRVHTSHPPVFRKGSSLDNTSVLFIDATGHVREFTLGQGAEVGISGLTRAERLEWRDVDGDGVDDLVTTWHGESTVWDARNNPISLPRRRD